MQINGAPNKFKIFQDFYYETNGVVISYNQAIRLFYQMDNTTETHFIEYYADEVGYELIQKSDESGEPIYDPDGNPIYVNIPYSGPSGFNLDAKAGKGLMEHYIRQKYSIQAYAAKNGIKIDSKWNQFSAKEIMQMYNDGVNIPQEVVDAAQTILQSDGANLIEGAEEEAEEKEVTEKETFLELIPKAAKSIKKTNENTDKLDGKVQELIEDTQVGQKGLNSQLKNQKKSLEEYEKLIREWRILQNKVNNGEELTNSEAARYAQITGMLEDKNNSENFQLDKLSIARKLNEINILAVLGEQLAGKTIEIGEQLADYTSQTNYKTTRNQVAGEIGFLSALIAMIQGKDLANEAQRIGQEAKEYTDETSDSVNDIASLMGVEKLIVNPSSQTENSESFETEAAENEAVEQTEMSEQIKPTEDKFETIEAAESKNTTIEDDFIINDKNIQQLISHAEELNADLVSEIHAAIKNTDIAKGDENYVKFVDKLVSKLIKDFEAEEAKRQEEIESKEKENKKAQKEIENLGGGNEENQRLAQELIGTEFDENNENKERIAEQQKIIDKNNKDILSIKEDSETSREEFKTKTKGIKNKINESVPEESNALKSDSEYKNEIIPLAKEELMFTKNSGRTLNKMGKYRITVGIEQIRMLQFRKGFYNIAKGRISSGLGHAADVIGNPDIVNLAEKVTNRSTSQENTALDKLNTLDTKIVNITGDNAAADLIEEDENKNNEEQEDKISEKTPEKEASQKSNYIENKISENAKENPVEINDETTKSGTKTGVGGGKKAKKEMSTDDAQDNVENINKAAKESAKDSAKVDRETQKDEKQLQKETKKLTKQMQKDQKDIIKMTKESLQAAKKQEEILVKYEQLTQENEKIATEEENKNLNAPSKQQEPQQAPQKQGVVTNSFGITDTSISTTSDNSDKLESNNQEIANLSAEFNIAGRTITRNKNKMVIIQKSTQKNQKKVVKKSKIRTQKIKEAEKKEQDKQKRLTKQLGAVGIAENLFTITETTGLTMIAIGTAMITGGQPLIAAGTVLKTIGVTGLGTCAVAKATINIANGNLTGALVSLGSTAVTVTTSMTGVGAAAGGVLGYVSNGLQVVASSADLVNNIRAVQGKEANGIMSKISTIAGVSSSITSSAATLNNLDKAGSTFGKISQIGGVVGSSMSNVSQIMSEFGLGSEQAQQLLGSIGGAVSLAASIGQMTAKKDEADSNNNDNTETVEEAKSEENTEQTTEKEENSTESTKEETEEIKNDENNAVNPIIANAAAVNEETAGIKEIELNARVTTNETRMDEAAINNNATTNETQNIIKENAETEQARLLNNDERKIMQEQIKNQEKIADEAGLKGFERKNVIENGASREFADVDDSELQNRIEGILGGEGTQEDMKLAMEGKHPLQNEQQNRQKYQKTKDLLEENNTTNKISGIIEGLGQLTSLSGTAMSLFASNNNEETTVRKKGTFSNREYLRDKRFREIATSNENYFTGHSDDQKRRFKKFAKRV